MSQPVRLLVVDDHPIFRMGVVQLLSAEPDLEVCGEADTLAAARDQIAQVRPDVILLDLSLGGDNGLALLADRGDARVLVVSMHDETLYAERSLREGASGYVSKLEGADRLIESIRQVASGRIALSPQMSDLLVRRAAGQLEPATTALDLSKREREIFNLIGKGCTTREIAERLGIRPRTVDSHKAHMRQRLGLGTTAELTRAAVQWVSAL